jgi:hypothetical protein
MVYQPPRVVFHLSAFDVIGGLHNDGKELLKRLQGLVSQVQQAHDDLVWFSVHRGIIISYTIAREVGRQSATRLPLWEAQV